MLIAMFLVSIATILYVLDAVVVPSTRYTYLERLQSEQFKKYLAVNNFQQSIFGFVGQSSNPSTPSKVKASPQHL